MAHRIFANFDYGSENHPNAIIDKNRHTRWVLEKRRDYEGQRSSERERRLRS